MAIHNILVKQVQVLRVENLNHKSYGFGLEIGADRDTSIFVFSHPNSIYECDQ